MVYLFIMKITWYHPIIRISNSSEYKIIIPILLILAVAWYVLWIPTEDVGSRLTTSIVAFLSLIAFNFVFQDDIPKLDILTSLDKFILLSYAFCAIPIFTTIRLSKSIEKNDDDKNYNINIENEKNECSEHSNTTKLRLPTHLYAYRSIISDGPPIQPIPPQNPVYLPLTRVVLPVPLVSVFIPTISESIFCQSKQSQP